MPARLRHGFGQRQHRGRHRNLRRQAPDLPGCQRVAQAQAALLRAGGVAGQGIGDGLLPVGVLAHGGRRGQGLQRIQAGLAQAVAQVAQVAVVPGRGAAGQALAQVRGGDLAQVQQRRLRQQQQPAQRQQGRAIEIRQPRQLPVASPQAAERHQRIGQAEGQRGEHHQRAIQPVQRPAVLRHTQRQRIGGQAGEERQGQQRGAAEQVPQPAIDSGRDATLPAGVKQRDLHGHHRQQQAGTVAGLPQPGGIADQQGQREAQQ